MSKTVTTAFTNAWASKYGKVAAHKVQFKRRYWNGSAYVYESNWTALATGTPRDLVSIIPKNYESIGQINQKLDLPFLNTMKVSNVTLKLNNTDMQWLPTNGTTGIFAGDLTVPNGYEPFLTKFQVLFGYRKADGTFEFVTLFTGVAIDFVFDTTKAVVDVTVSGNEWLLQSADAQLVSTAFTDENTTATGDGSTKAFTTTSLGVGRITTVKIAGVTKTQGTDYTISGLNQYGVGATINFVVAPAGAAQPTATGIKWKTLQKLEDLIGLLCDQAGIGSGNRTINPVIIPGSVSGAITLNSTADWNAGTLVNIDTVTYAAASQYSIKWLMIDDFVNATLHNWSIWSQHDGGTGTYSTVFSTGSVSFGNTDTVNGTNEVNIYRYIYKDAINTPLGIGSWSWKLTLPTASGNGYVTYIGANNNRPGEGLIHSYGYYLAIAGNSTTGVVQLIRFDGGAGTMILDLGTIISAGTHEYRITITVAGLITVYKDNAALGSVTDTTYQNFSAFEYFGIQAAADVIKLGYPMYSPIVDGADTNNYSAATMLSAEKDILSAPNSWGLLQVTDALNGGTAAFYTNVASVSGGPYDGLVAVAGNGQILSNLKEFLKIEGALTFNYDTGSSTLVMLAPQVSVMKANYSSQSISVAMANFSGKTCFDAVQRLAQIADYEWGFDGSGNFFFRSKSVTNTPLLALDQSKGVVRISQMRPGYDLVINDGQVTYNGYYSEYNSSSLPEGNPTSQARFGSIIKQDTLSDILLANDANLAAGRAQLIHDNNYLPKRRLRATTKIIPQLDLSDVISISFYTNPNIKNNIFGDPGAIFDVAAFGQAQDNLLTAVNFKVIGIIYDLDKLTCDLDLQEVLS